MATAAIPGLACPPSSAPERTRRRVALVAPSFGAGERAQLRLLEAAELLCLPVEDEPAAIERALRWQPDLMLFASEASLSQRLRWMVLLRERTACPVVMLGAADESDELVLLEAGFDAVWREPGSARLLRSRIEALLRGRAPVPASRGSRLWLGPLAIDAESMTARHDGRPLGLTRTQVQLLHALARAPLNTLSRAQIAAALERPGAEAAPATLRRVDTLVSRLRARLQDLGLAAIDVLPVRGYGYRLQVEETRLDRRAAGSLLPLASGEPMAMPA